MLSRITKSFSLAIKVAVISFDRAFNHNHEIDEILGFTDELTKLPNLKAFERDHRKAKEDYALVLIDIDNFKEINDTHGHKYGDAVLKRIAYILSFAVDFCGKAYRLHGDEYAIIAKKQEVHRICDEIHEHIRKDDSFSVSQGIVVMNNSNAFALADSALYQSKRMGKSMTTIMAS